MNLRGIKESGTVFAIPTYGFVLCVFAMLALGLAQMLGGDAPVAESAAIGIAPEQSVRRLLLVGAGAARLRLRLHRADGRGGGQQRRPELQGAQEPQRGRDPGDHGGADDRDVRRDHRPGAGQQVHVAARPLRSWSAPRTATASAP